MSVGRLASQREDIQRCNKTQGREHAMSIDVGKECILACIGRSLAFYSVPTRGSQPVMAWEVLEMQTLEDLRDSLD